MVTLYAPVDTGRVIGLCGSEFRINGGIVEVNEQDVPGLLGNGFMLAGPAAEDVQPELKKPARKAVKKEKAE